jgi:hypothetical protein
MSDKTMNEFLHENKVSPDEARTLMFHLSTYRASRLNDAIDTYHYVCVKCMTNHRRVYSGCEFQSVQSKLSSTQQKLDVAKEALLKCDDYEESKYLSRIAKEALEAIEKEGE